MATAQQRSEIIQQLRDATDDDFNDLILELAICIWLDHCDNDRDEVMYVVGEAIDEIEEGRE